jgi:preprotein translocase subunit SecG
MEYLLIGVHVLVCVVLIGVVLLQSGKAADLAGAFGGGGSQTALGSRGAATVLTKATTISAILFMITSLSLAILGSRRTGSVLEQAPAPVSAPASPAPAAGSPPAGEAGGSEAGKAAAPAAGAPEPAKSPAPK